MAIETTLKLLRQNMECKSVDADGSEWGSVYLDNARQSGQTVHQFRSDLAQLAKRGLYRPLDGSDFGDVRASD